MLPPVDFGEGVTVEHSIVGLYVNVDENDRTKNSRVKDAIPGEGSKLYDINLTEALTGASLTMSGVPT